MTRTKSKYLCLLAILLLIPFSANADFIEGEVGFGGAFVPTGGTSLADATGINFLTGFVIAGSGDYAGVAPFTGVLFTDFQFDPFGPSPVEPLWQFTYDGISYSFDLYSIVVNLQTSSQLNLEGAGILSATGFDDTAGTWSFSADGGDIIFVFSSVSGATAAVPEPGTLALLGIGLLGMGLSRRRKKV